MTDILSKAAKRNLNIQKLLQHNKFRAAAGRNIRPAAALLSHNRLLCRYILISLYPYILNMLIYPSSHVLKLPTPFGVMNLEKSIL